MNNTQLPEAFQSVMGLGAPIRYFPVKKFNRWGNLVIAILLFISAAVITAYGIYDALWWTQHYGPVMFQARIMTPLIIAGILFFIGVLLAWSAYDSWKKGAVVYERGFAYSDRKGIQAWRFEDCASVTAAVTRHYTNGIYTGTTHRYTLLDRQNRHLVLGDALGKVEELDAAIEKGIFPQLYEQAAGRYNAGETLVFGPVSLNKNGLQIGKKAFSWPEVGAVSVQRGILQVSKKDGGWFSGANTSVAVIPNLRVLLSLIDQIVGIKTA